MRRGCRHSLLLVLHGLDDASQLPDLRPQLLHGCLAAGLSSIFGLPSVPNREMGSCGSVVAVPKEEG